MGYDDDHTEGGGTMPFEEEFLRELTEFLRELTDSVDSGMMKAALAQVLLHPDSYDTFEALAEDPGFLEESGLLRAMTEELLSNDGVVLDGLVQDEAAVLEHPALKKALADKLLSDDSLADLYKPSPTGEPKANVAHPDAHDYIEELMDWGTYQRNEENIIDAKKFTERLDEDNFRWNNFMNNLSDKMENAQVKAHEMGDTQANVALRYRNIFKNVKKIDNWIEQNPDTTVNVKKIKLNVKNFMHEYCGLGDFIKRLGNVEDDKFNVKKMCTGFLNDSPIAVEWNDSVDEDSVDEMSGKLADLDSRKLQRILSLKKTYGLDRCDEKYVPGYPQPDTEMIGQGTTLERILENNPFDKIDTDDFCTFFEYLS